MLKKTESLQADSFLDGDAPFLERLIFGRRPLFLLIFALLTVFLGYHAMQLKPEASFLRMIPTYHPYIKNYIAHQQDLKGLGNAVRIAVDVVNVVLRMEGVRFPAVLDPLHRPALEHHD